ERAGVRQPQLAASGSFGSSPAAFEPAAAPAPKPPSPPALVAPWPAAPPAPGPPDDPPLELPPPPAAGAASTPSGIGSLPVSCAPMSGAAPRKPSLKFG